MASDHTADSSVFNDTISMLTGADVKSATQLRTILEKIHNNTAYLRAQQPLHSGAAKFWLHAQVSAGVPAVSASYNVTSITDGGVGILVVTIGTDFSSAFWVCQALLDNVGADLSVRVTSRNVGSVTLFCTNNATNAAADPDAWNVVGFGNQ